VICDRNNSVAINLFYEENQLDDVIFDNILFKKNDVRKDSIRNLQLKVVYHRY